MRVELLRTRYYEGKDDANVDHHGLGCIGYKVQGFVFSAHVRSL